MDEQKTNWEICSMIADLDIAGYIAGSISLCVSVLYNAIMVYNGKECAENFMKELIPALEKYANAKVIVKEVK